jgi:antitoxin component YwqK of YwqJK toxin-antitoxin module
MGWAIAGLLAIVAGALIVCFLWVVLFPPDLVYRYPSGAVQARGQHHHGDKQGRWTYYYESGGKEREGEYLAGFESGAWSFWYANGQLRARGQLDGDRFKTGEWTYFDEVGQPLSEVEFLTRHPGDSPIR